MYLGKIVEIADRETLYDRPHHPYTQALLSAVPDVKQAAIGGRRERIRLEGDVPEPDQPAVRLPVPHPLPDGPGDLRQGQEPPLLQIGPRHKVACHFAGELGQHPDQAGHRRALLGVDDQGNPDPGAAPDARPVGRPARLRRHLVRPAGRAATGGERPDRRAP